MRDKNATSFTREHREKTDTIPMYNSRIDVRNANATFRTTLEIVLAGLAPSNGREFEMHSLGWLITLHIFPTTNFDRVKRGGLSPLDLQPLAS